MINKILIAGFCEVEPVLVKSKDGKCIETSFKICSTVVDENDKSITEFYNFTAYNWLAHDIYTRMKQGNQVYIESRLTSKMQLIAVRMEWLMKRKPDQTRRV